MNSRIKTHKICKFDSQKKDIFPPKANCSGKIIIFNHGLPHSFSWRSQQAVVWPRCSARNFRVETWGLSAADPAGGGGVGALEVGQEKMRGKFCAYWETQVRFVTNSGVKFSYFWAWKSDSVKVWANFVHVVRLRWASSKLFLIPGNLITLPPPSSCF